MLGPSFGLGLRDSALVILFFTLLSTIAPAFLSTLGPKTGMRQMIQARFSFGLVSPAVLGTLDSRLLSYKLQALSRRLARHSKLGDIDGLLCHHLRGRWSVSLCRGGRSPHPDRRHRHHCRHIPPDILLRLQGPALLRAVRLDRGPHCHCHCNRMRRVSSKRAGSD
jgi:Permease for cytosine/purines, uracil, thiamine, allantoin